MSELDDDRQRRIKNKIVARAVKEMREIERAASQIAERSGKPYGFHFEHKMDLAEIWIYFVFLKKDYSTEPPEVIRSHEHVATVPDHIQTVAELPGDVQASLRVIDRDMVPAFESWLVLVHKRKFAVPFRLNPVHVLKRAILIFKLSLQDEGEVERMLDTFADLPDLPEALILQMRTAQNFLAGQVSK